MTQANNRCHFYYTNNVVQVVSLNSLLLLPYTDCQYVSLLSSMYHCSESGQERIDSLFPLQFSNLVDELPGTLLVSVVGSVFGDFPFRLLFRSYFLTLVPLSGVYFSSTDLPDVFMYLLSCVVFNMGIREVWDRVLDHWTTK